MTTVKEEAWELCKSNSEEEVHLFSAITSVKHAPY